MGPAAVCAWPGHAPREPRPCSLSALRGLSAGQQTWAHPADLSTGNTLVMAETSIRHLISQSAHNSRVDLSPSDSWRPLLSATENALETFTKILSLDRVLGLLKSDKVEKATPKPGWLYSHHMLFRPGFILWLNSDLQFQKYLVCACLQRNVAGYLPPATQKTTPTAITCSLRRSHI